MSSNPEVKILIKYSATGAASIHTNQTLTKWSYSMSEFKSKRQELMTITMEECGELIQACSKAIRCGTYEKNDDLIEELCDVKCMIDLMIELA